MTVEAANRVEGSVGSGALRNQNLSYKKVFNESNKCFSLLFFKSHVTHLLGVSAGSAHIKILLLLASR